MNEPDRKRQIREILDRLARERQGKREPEEPEWTDHDDAWRHECKRQDAEWYKSLIRSQADAARDWREIADINRLCGEPALAASALETARRCDEARRLAEVRLAELDEA